VRREQEIETFNRHDYQLNRLRSRCTSLTTSNLEFFSSRLAAHPRLSDKAKSKSSETISRTCFRRAEAHFEILFTHP
jgi:hypothetical protein